MQVVVVVAAAAGEISRRESTQKIKVTWTGNTNAASGSERTGNSDIASKIAQQGDKERQGEEEREGEGEGGEQHVAVHARKN